MEPTENRRSEYNLNIKWTQAAWSSPALRYEIQSMCDRLYTDASNKLVMQTIDQLDLQVEGDDHPAALELIMGAYLKHKNV